MGQSNTPLNGLMQLQCEALLKDFRVTSIIMSSNPFLLSLAPFGHSQEHA